MKITIRKLKTIIYESLGGSYPDESYDHFMVDDESFKGDSKLVPEKAKIEIKKWLKDMRLDGHK